MCHSVNLISDVSEVSSLVALLLSASDAGSAVRYLVYRAV
jgi:hypothetical protein